MACIVVGSLLVGLVTVTASAQAHHAEIEATVDCDSIVRWTARSWHGSGPAEQTNHSVRVWYVIGEDVEVELAQGAFTNGNSYSFGGELAWPGPDVDSFTLFVREQVNWGLTSDGVSPGAARSITVTLPEGCNEDSPADEVEPVEVEPELDLSPEVEAVEEAGPSVVAAVSCVEGDGEVIVTLGNTGTGSLTYVVTDPRSGSSQQVDVGAGELASVVLTGFADGTYLIGVSTGGDRFDQSVTVDCDPPGIPSAAAALSCVSSAGQVTVVLGNSASADAETILFTVGEPTLMAGGVAGAVQFVMVPPGEHRVVEFEGLADGTYAIAITADGVELAPLVVEVACPTTPVTTPATTPATAAPATVVADPGGRVAVLGASQTAPSTGRLPATGSETGRLVLFAIGLMMCGSGLFLLGRRHHL